MYLGSLSLDINNLLIQIIHREDILNVGKDLPGWIEFEQKQWSPEELQQMTNNAIDSINTILNSDELQPKLDQLIAVIEKQSSLDDIQGEDWSIVYNSLKKQLRANPN